MKYVLFVCDHNAGRSQMAQALFAQRAPSDLIAESAGSSPARQVWPNVVRAMAELGVDLSDRRPRKLTPEVQLHADWAVTMGCGDACPYVPGKVEAWDVPDVAHMELDAVRDVRDRIDALVTDLLDNRVEEIRADRTAHDLRLAQLLPGLIEEFEGRRSAGEIRACADEVLSEYGRTPVRSFALTLAERRSRECLQTGSMDCRPAVT